MVISEADETGKVVNPRMQFLLSALQNEEIKGKLVQLFEDWSEYALATILEIARSHGIKYVAINSSDSIATRDPSVDPQKIKMYYDHLAKSLGFKKEKVDTGQISGIFWVRKASIRSYLTAR